MDIATLVAVGLLVTERIVVHIITGINRCKSHCGCSSCDLSKDHEHQETAGTPRVEIPKNL
jgi:hypothetical protein